MAAYVSIVAISCVVLGILTRPRSANNGKCETFCVMLQLLSIVTAFGTALGDMVVLIYYVMPSLELQEKALRLGDTGYTGFIRVGLTITLAFFCLAQGSLL